MDMKLEKFESIFGQLRSISIGDEPWFLARDVAAILKYYEGTKVATKNMTRHIDGRELRVLNVVGAENAPQDIVALEGMILISEAGVYEAIFRRTSSKNIERDEVEEFKFWVTHTVLPSIRKNGGYIYGQESLPDVEQLELVRELKNTVARLQKRRHELIAEVKKQEAKRKAFKETARKAQVNYQIIINDLIELEDILNKERSKYDDLFAQFINAKYAAYKDIEREEARAYAKHDAMYAVKVDSEGFIL